MKDESPRAFKQKLLHLSAFVVYSWRIGCFILGALVVRSPVVRSHLFESSGDSRISRRHVPATAA